jgi:hypothetical protein
MVVIRESRKERRGEECVLGWRIIKESGEVVSA